MSLSLPSLRFKLIESKASESYPVHNLDTGLNYSAIQEAINADETLDGHTLLVDEGIYYENVVVNKSLSLIGGSRETTIVDGGKKGTAVNITVNNVILTRFTAKNSEPTSGIYLHSANFTSVTDNIVKENTYGIELLSSSNSTVNANQIVDNQFHGIVLGASHNNTIGQNNLTRNNSEAINLFLSDRNYVHDNNMVDNEAAIWMDDSFFNIFSNNIIRNCTVSYLHVIAAADSVGNSFVGNDIDNFNHTQQGLVLYSCNETLVVANNIKDCECGLYLATSYGNRIYHNNLVDNIRQAYVFGTSLDNAWDNGFEGNYWSDYNSRYFDEYGIGAIWNPYAIDADNIDYHPLVGMFSEFKIFLPYEKTENVTVISNSTVSNLSLMFWLSSPTDVFQPGQPFIQFSATGENGNGGFCRLMIPRTVLNSSSYIVLVDSNPINATELPVSNSTHVYLYFTYTHSTHEVIVTIPEFSWLILSLLMIATLLAVTFYRKNAV